MKKKTLALAATVTLALAACGGSEDAAQDGDHGTIVLGGQPTADYTPVHVGMQEGLFEEAGIDLDLVPLTGAGTAVTSLTNGSIDVVDQSPLVAAKANQDGSDLKLICGTTDGHWSKIMKKAGSDVPVATGDDWQSAVKQWKGLSVGVPTLNGAVHYWVVDLLEAAGMDAGDVTFVASGAGEAAITTLSQGDVDLLLTYPFLTQSLGDRGEVALDLRTQGPDELKNQANGSWMASSAWLDDNADLAQKFCDTMDTAITYVQDPTNAETVKASIEKNFGLPPEVTSAAMEDDGPLARLSTELPCDEVELVLDGAVKHDLLAAEPAQSCDSLLWKR